MEFRVRSGYSGDDFFEEVLIKKNSEEGWVREGGKGGRNTCAETVGIKGVIGA
jgi:hypothetical protein